MPHDPSGLKLGVARRLYDLICDGGPKLEDSIMGRTGVGVAGVNTVDVSRTDNLNFQVRVRQDGAPVRYFNIKVSEQM